jgi:hypothetical protein
LTSELGVVGNNSSHRMSSTCKFGIVVRRIRFAEVLLVVRELFIHGSRELNARFNNVRRENS